MLTILTRILRFFSELHEYLMLDIDIQYISLFLILSADFNTKLIKLHAFTRRYGNVTERLGGQDDY